MSNAENDPNEMILVSRKEYEALWRIADASAQLAIARFRHKDDELSLEIVQEFIYALMGVPKKGI